MASDSQTLKNHESKRIRANVSDIPIEIWEKIISKLNNHDHDHRHCDFYLQSLSRVSKYFLSITNHFKQTLIISDPASYFLPSLFHRFPNLKHLSLSNFSGDRNPILLQIADLDYRLESLDLSDDYLPVEALNRLPVSTLSGVKSLNISSLNEILDDDDLQMIGNLFPNLKELDISRPNQSTSIEERDDYATKNRCLRLLLKPEKPHINRPSSSCKLPKKVPTCVGFSAFASKLKGLRRINLEGNHWVSDAFVISLAENCPDLEEIVLRDGTLVTKTSVWIHDNIIQPLTRTLSSWASYLSNAYVDDQFLFKFADARLPLKSFTLITTLFYKRVTYDGISWLLTTYDSLDHLELEGLDFLSDIHMVTLVESLTKLRSVKLNNCGNLSESTLLTLIKECPLLEAVEMKHTNVGTRGFGVENAHNPRMKTLDLSLNKKLSDESLAKIAMACPNLKTLRLLGCVGISGKGVEETFRKCRRLKHLEIDGCIGVKSLDLDRNSHELEFLSALTTDLDDEALISIAENCPELMFLNVRDCVGLTSKGVIEVVDKCTKLKEINLHYCQNMNGEMLLPWMVFNRPSLRKIVPPYGDYQNSKAQFMRHGCYVPINTLYPLFRDWGPRPIGLMRRPV